MLHQASAATLEMFCRQSLCVLASLALLLPGHSRAADPPPPLPFAPVVQYFTKATGARPWRVHDQCVIIALSEARAAKDHQECVIVVTADPGRLAVSFLVSGGFGMNFVREFFESPFFGAAEAQSLYRLLEAPPGTNTVRTEKFTMEFTRAETTEWMFLSLSFGPPTPATPTPGPAVPLPPP